MFANILYSPVPNTCIGSDVSRLIASTIETIAN